MLHKSGISCFIKKIKVAAHLWSRVFAVAIVSVIWFSFAPAAYATPVLHMVVSDPAVTPDPTTIPIASALPTTLTVNSPMTRVRISYYTTGGVANDCSYGGGPYGSAISSSPVNKQWNYSSVATAHQVWNPSWLPNGTVKHIYVHPIIDGPNTFSLNCNSSSGITNQATVTVNVTNPTPDLRIVPSDSHLPAPTSIAAANAMSTTQPIYYGTGITPAGRMTYYSPSLMTTLHHCMESPNNAPWGGYAYAQRINPNGQGYWAPPTSNNFPPPNNAPTSVLQNGTLTVLGVNNTSNYGSQDYYLTCDRPGLDEVSFNGNTTSNVTAQVSVKATTIKSTAMPPWIDLRLVPTDWSTGSAPTTVAAANALPTTTNLPTYNSTGRITYYSPNNTVFSSCSTPNGPNSNPANTYWNGSNFSGANLANGSLKNKGSITGLTPGVTNTFSLSCVRASDGVVVTATAQMTVPAQPAVDLCPNIAGTQATIPTGYVIDANGSCVPDLRMVPTDVANNGPTTIAAANALPTTTTFADTSHQGRLTYYSPAGAQYFSCTPFSSSPANTSWNNAGFLPVPTSMPGNLGQKFPITGLVVGNNSFVLSCITATGVTAMVTATITVTNPALPDLRLVPTDSTAAAPGTVNAANTAPTTITLPNTNSTARLTYYSPTGAVFSQCSVSPAGPTSTPTNTSWNTANFAGANIADGTLKHKTPITNLAVGQNDFVLKCVKNGALVTATATVNVTALGAQQTIRIVPLDHVITAPEIANFANLPTTITVTTPDVRLYYNAPNNTTGALSGCFGLGTNVSSQYLAADFTSAGHDPVQTVREVYPVAPMPLAQVSPNQFQISCMTPGVTSNTAVVNFNLPSPTLALVANPVGPLNPGNYFTTLTWTTNNASAWVANSCNGVGGGASSGWVTNGKPAPTANGIGSNQPNVYVATSSVTFMVTCTTTALYGSQQISAQVTVTRNPPTLSFDSLHCPPTAPFHANDYSYNWTSNFAAGTVCTNPSTTASANPVPQATLTKPNTGNGIINSVGAPVYYISCRDMNVPGNATPVQVVNTQMSVGQYNVVYPSYGYSYCYCPPNPTPTETLCTNGIDDDCDGYTDTQDTDCTQGTTTGATATGTATATATATAGATAGIPGKPKIKEN